jgi:DNA polymerase-1
MPREFKPAVAVAPDKTLVEVDYAQFELRILAQLAGCQTMLRACEQGEDLHLATAASILGKACADVSQDDRQLGKRVNFAIIYGQRATQLAQKIDGSTADAEELIAAFFEQYPAVKNWSDGIVRQFEKTGVVRSIFGRQFKRPTATDRPCSGRESRRAVNFVVQATAAEIFKLNLLRLKAVLKSRATIVMPVHDAVLLETPRSQVEEVAKVVKVIMEQSPQRCPAPIVVRVSCGANWAEMQRVASSHCSATDRVGPLAPAANS